MNKSLFLVAGIIVGLAVGFSAGYFAMQAQLTSLQQSYASLNSQYQIQNNSYYQLQTEYNQLSSNYNSLQSSNNANQQNYDLLINRNFMDGNGGLGINDVTIDANAHSVTGITVQNQRSYGVVISSVCLIYSPMVQIAGGGYELNTTPTSWLPENQIPIIATDYKSVSLTAGATLNLPVTLLLGDNIPSNQYSIKVITSDGLASYFMAQFDFTRSGTDHIG